jgi:hypothetical protein
MKDDLGRAKREELMNISVVSAVSGLVFAKKDAR